LASATILHLETEQPVHGLEAPRRDHGPPLALNSDKSGVAQTIEVECARARRETERVSDGSRRHSVRPGLHKEAATHQAGSLGLGPPGQTFFLNYFPSVKMHHSIERPVGDE
jgi:hypothetical protein